MSQLTSTNRPRSWPFHLFFLFELPSFGEMQASRVARSGAAGSQAARVAHSNMICPLAQALAGLALRLAKPAGPGTQINPQGGQR